MEVEGIRIIARWLRGTIDAASGVNTLLAGVPRYAGDPLPPAVTIYDEFERDETALRHFTEDSTLLSPCLFVHEFAGPDVVEIEGNVASGEQDGTMHVGIVYGDKRAEPALVGLNARYTMRAVRRSLVRLSGFSASGSQPVEENGVELVTVDTIRRLLADPVTANGRISLTTIATITLRDNDPIG